MVKRPACFLTPSVVLLWGPTNMGPNGKSLQEKGGKAVPRYLC